MYTSQFSQPHFWIYSHSLKKRVWGKDGVVRSLGIPVWFFMWEEKQSAQRRYVYLYLKVCMPSPDLLDQVTCDYLDNWYLSQPQRYRGMCASSTLGRKCFWHQNRNTSLNTSVVYPSIVYISPKTLRRVLKSPNIIVDLSPSPLVMYFEALWLGT